MRMYRSGNGGEPSIAAGSLKNVNSYNVSPLPLVATAAGLVFDYPSLSNNYEYFNISQTSAGTDSIVLPDSLPVGTELWFQAASAISIQCPTGSTVLLNNVAAPAKGALAANATAKIIKVSATRIIFVQYSTLGVASAPVPS